MTWYITRLSFWPLLTLNDIHLPTLKPAGVLYSMWSTNISNKNCFKASWSSWDIVLKKFSLFHQKLPQSTFHFHQNKWISWTQCGTPTYLIWASLHKKVGITNIHNTYTSAWMQRPQLSLKQKSDKQQDLKIIFNTCYIWSLQSIK